MFSKPLLTLLEAGTWLETPPLGVACGLDASVDVLRLLKLLLLIIGERYSSLALVTLMAEICVLYASGFIWSFSKLLCHIWERKSLSFYCWDASSFVAAPDYY